MKKTALLLAALLATAGPASAQVYKCTNAAGKVEFSDAPCTNASRAEVMAPRDNTLDTSKARESAMRERMNELQQRMEEMERRQQSESAQRGRTDADVLAERIDSEACERAKRSLDLEASSLKKNKDAIAAKRSAMYGACGMKEPDVTNINEGERRRPVTITNCDPGGCWTSDGRRLVKIGGGRYSGPNGLTCQTIGNRVQCP